MKVWLNGLLGFSKGIPILRFSFSASASGCCGVVEINPFTRVTNSGEMSWQERSEIN